MTELWMVVRQDTYSSAPDEKTVSIFKVVAEKADKAFLRANVPSWEKETGRMLQLCS